MSPWDEVGVGCFRRRYQAFDLNIGVVRGADALLVLDTRADLDEADELLRELRVFGRPVRWVVNSHWHFDHVFGNQRFPEQAGHPDGLVHAAVELWGHEAVPAMLREVEDELKSRLRANFGDEAGDRYDRVHVTPPDHLVAAAQVLDLGDRGVELRHPGRGHTHTDLVLVVPDAGVVFAGDLLEESAPPAYGADSFPLEWPATARAVLDAGDGAFVPGHGDVMAASAAADQLAAIEVVAATIRALHGAGVPVDDALTEGRAHWPFPPEALETAVRLGYEALGAPGS